MANYIKTEQIVHFCSSSASPSAYRNLSWFLLTREQQKTQNLSIDSPVLFIDAKQKQTAIGVEICYGYPWMTVAKTIFSLCWEW
jgi:hypothetical protein